MNKTAPIEDGTVAIEIDFEPDELDRAKETAEYLGITLDELIAQALRDRLKEHLKE